MKSGNKSFSNVYETHQGFPNEIRREKHTLMFTKQTNDIRTFYIL